MDGALRPRLALRWRVWRSSLTLKVLNGVGLAAPAARGTTMEHYAGIDVSLKGASICVVDGSGKIAREGQVASEPEALLGWFGSLAAPPARIGLEAGPLSQWLYAALTAAGL